MVQNPNGSGPREGSLRCYALVAYIPDPMGQFLDDLRRELVPGFVPRAHVSVLQPRWVTADADTSARHLRSLAGEMGPFDIEAGDVEIFDVSHVAFLNINRGLNQLHHLNQVANSGPLRFEPTFPYHPHITLAQNLPYELAREAVETARQKWQEFAHARHFLAEKLMFVESRIQDVWEDLEEIHLGTLQHTAG